jgi:hypothetical protein
MVPLGQNGAVGAGVCVSVAVAVAVAVGVLVGVDVGVDVGDGGGVSVSVGEGVTVGFSKPPVPHAEASTEISATLSAILWFIEPPLLLSSTPPSCGRACTTQAPKLIHSRAIRRQWQLAIMRGAGSRPGAACLRTRRWPAAARCVRRCA